MYNYVGSKVRPEFIQEIKKYGLVPPSTNHGCRGILLFIHSGNILYKGTRDERIEFLKQMQTEWIGQEVIRISNSETGTVKSIVPLTEWEIVDLKRTFPHKNLIAFKVLVKWAQRNSQFISPDLIRKAERS